MALGRRIDRMAEIRRRLGKAGEIEMGAPASGVCVAMVGIEAARFVIVADREIVIAFVLLGIPGIGIFEAVGSGGGRSAQCEDKT
jgi:hypothetical protein